MLKSPQGSRRQRPVPTSNTHPPILTPSLRHIDKRRRYVVFPHPLLNIIKRESEAAASTHEQVFPNKRGGYTTTAASLLRLSTVSTSSMRGGAMKLIHINPKTITASQKSQLTEMVPKAFVDFNKAMTTIVHPDLMKEEFGEPIVIDVIMESLVSSRDAFAVLDGDDGKIVGVTFVSLSTEGPNKVASIGPVASSAPGAGRKSFEAACNHAESLGFNPVVLSVAGANTRAFSLYAKMGFEAKHTLQYFGGFLSSDNDDAASDTTCTISEMTDKDLDECGALFTAAHGNDSWDRRPFIAHAVESDFPFPILVARGANGELVGYSTGFFLEGHQVSKSEEVFKALFRESSRIHKERGLPTPRFHNYLEHPSLVSWALSEKLTLLRTAMVMAKGRYEHDAWPKKGYVVTPSSEGW